MLDYYGTGMGCIPAFAAVLAQIETASDEELIQMAADLNLID